MNCGMCCDDRMCSDLACTLEELRGCSTRKFNGLRLGGVAGCANLRQPKILRSMFGGVERHATQCRKQRGDPTGNVQAPAAWPLPSLKGTFRLFSPSLEFDLGGVSLADRGEWRSAATIPISVVCEKYYVKVPI
jgi:hypothetical protein